MVVAGYSVVLMFGGKSSETQWPAPAVYEFVDVTGGQAVETVYVSGAEGWGQLPIDSGAFGRANFAFASLLLPAATLTFVFGGIVEGAYAYLSDQLTLYAPSCDPGAMYQANCTEHYNWDCACQPCPPGQYSPNALPTCLPCPLDSYTAAEGATALTDCSVCRPDFCNGHGACFISDPAVGTAHCSCHFGYSASDNCGRNWFLVILLSSLAGFAGLSVVAYLLYRCVLVRAAVVLLVRNRRAFSPDGATASSTWRACPTSKRACFPRSAAKTPRCAVFWASGAPLSRPTLLTRRAAETHLGDFGRRAAAGQPHRQGQLRRRKISSRRPPKADSVRLLAA